MLQSSYVAALVFLLIATIPAATSASDLAPEPTPTFPPRMLTATPRATATATGTVTSTPTVTATPTDTPTPTDTRPPTATVPTATPTPTPSPTEEVQPTPEPTKAPAITFDITPQARQYWITDQASMPTDIVVVPRMTGIDDAIVDNLIFTWTVQSDYQPSDYDPAHAPGGNISYRWPDQLSQALDPFTPSFGDVVRGGTLTMTATIWLFDNEYSATTRVEILGSNPSPSTLASYLSSRYPSTYYTLWRIAQAESGLQQFDENGHPKWSMDGQYGVGLMQITHPSPTPEQVWSWKRNAEAGAATLDVTYAVARSWPSTVAGSAQFTSAVAAVNAAREDTGEPKLLTVTVPDFSTGDLRCNPLQRERDAIRLYNGAGGKDDLGLPLHEYKLAYDKDAGLLDLVIDDSDGTAVAQWRHVEPSDRPASGAADYVDRVLSRQPPAPCG